MNFIKKNWKYIIGGIIALAAIYLLFIKPNLELKALEKQNETLKKEVLAKDTLQKLADGKYSKLVNTFNSTNDLNKILKTELSVIYDSIKNRKEKVLSINQNNITFKPKTNTVIVYVNKDSTYSFTSFYPQKDKYFIKYNGTLDTKSKTVTDDWSFTNFNLNVVMTQRKDGLWDSYLDGPEFLKVNSIKVNSLPAKDYIPTAEKQKLFVLYGGLGIRGNTDLNVNNKDLLIKGALTIKNKYMIQADYGTDKKVGVGVLVNF